MNGNRLFDYPAEVGAFVQTEGASSTVFNPDIAQPKADEVTLHLEREISAGFAARVGYVYKREANQFQLVNTARPGSVYNIPITVRRSWPRRCRRECRRWRAASRTTTTILRIAGRRSRSRRMSISPDFTDRYNNLEVGLDKRMSNNWQVQASYLATKKNMWVAGGPVRRLVRFRTRRTSEFFPKNQTWETTFRVSGSYRAPYDIVASSVFEYQSGAPLARDGAVPDQSASS